MAEDGKLTRRGFVKGAGIVGGAAALFGEVSRASGEESGRTVGPEGAEIALVVNGEHRKLRVEPRTTLVEALRDGMGLTGTKIGCDRGSCGACTVMLGDDPVPSCTVFALEAGGNPVTTIEGLARGPQLAPIQAAFVAHDTLQCGFCTPGMVMSCHALLQRNPHPREDDVTQAVSGNLCRCGTYPKVFEAALAAAAGQVAPPPQPAGTGAVDPGSVEALAVGIPGSLKKAERKVPGSEPRPWDGATKLAVVGQRMPRLEGPDKVTGRARYAFDLQIPGMLHAALATSPHPHARIKNVDVSEAEKLPGVRAVHVVEGILGPAELRLKPKSQEKYPRVRFEGQPIAAVAAVSKQQADDAVRKIKVEYEPLPHASDIEAAEQEGSPLVFEGPVEQPATAGGGGAAEGLQQKGSVRGPLVQTTPKEGEVDKALAESEVRVEERFATATQTHSAIELLGIVADYAPDGLTVYASTQGIHSVHEELSTLFELPKSKVRVLSEYTGGGFGAKFGAGNFGLIAAHLSRKARAPVRLFFDRRLEHLAAGNRPSSLQTLQLGATREGKLNAIKLVAKGSAGCAAGAGCSGPARNMYPAKVVHVEESDVFLHAGPAAAFRAPGHPQGAFALEQAMDALAEKLGIDPLELRDRNDPHLARREERRIGAARIGWAEARKRKPGASPGPGKRGG